MPHFRRGEQKEIKRRILIGIPDLRAIKYRYQSNLIPNLMIPKSNIIPSCLQSLFHLFVAVLSSILDGKYFFSFQKVQKKIGTKFELTECQQLFASIYTVLGVTSNLEMIQNMWEDMSKIYANTKPLFIRDLNIFRFWYLQGALETILHRYRGTIVINISINNSQPQTSDYRLHCLSRTMFLISPL